VLWLSLLCCLCFCLDLLGCRFNSVAFLCWRILCFYVFVFFWLVKDVVV